MGSRADYPTGSRQLVGPGFATDPGYVADPGYPAEAHHDPRYATEARYPAEPGYAAQAHHHAHPSDQSFGEILGKLRDDSTDLVKTEVELAKRETKQQIEIVEKRVAAAAIAGAVAHIGAALLLFSLAFLLALVMPLWASTLIVGVVACAAAAIIALRQKQALAELDPAPKRAIERVKQDFAAIKEAAR